MHQCRRYRRLIYAISCAKIPPLCFSTYPAAICSPLCYLYFPETIHCSRVSIHVVGWPRSYKDWLIHNNRRWRYIPSYGVFCSYLFSYKCNDNELVHQGKVEGEMWFREKILENRTAHENIRNKISWIRWYARRVKKNTCTSASSQILYPRPVM